MCNWVTMLDSRKLTKHYKLAITETKIHNIKNALIVEWLVQDRTIESLLLGVFPPAENPPLATDILCATLSCQQGRIRSLVLSALQGVILVHDHSQVCRLGCLRGVCGHSDWPRLVSPFRVWCLSRRDCAADLCGRHGRRLVWESGRWLVWASRPQAVPLTSSAGFSWHRLVRAAC